MDEALRPYPKAFCTFTKGLNLRLLIWSWKLKLTVNIYWCWSSNISSLWLLCIPISCNFKFLYSLINGILTLYPLTSSASDTSFSDVIFNTLGYISFCVKSIFITSSLKFVNQKISYESRKNRVVFFLYFLNFSFWINQKNNTSN